MVYVLEEISGFDEIDPFDGFLGFHLIPEIREISGIDLNLTRVSNLSSCSLILPTSRIRQLIPHMFVVDIFQIVGSVSA